jgi:hypothetical protein
MLSQRIRPTEQSLPLILITAFTLSSPQNMIHEESDLSHRRALLGMAQADPGYLTEDAYIEHRWKQDDLIRKEFEKHHNHVERRHRELRDDLDTVKGEIRQLQADVKELEG